MFQSLSGMSGDHVVGNQCHSLARINRTYQPLQVTAHNVVASCYVGSFLKEISVIVSGSIESTLLRSQRLGLGLGSFTGHSDFHYCRNA
jgi:hypothetical protein